MMSKTDHKAQRKAGESVFKIWFCFSVSYTEQISNKLN